MLTLTEPYSVLLYSEPPEHVYGMGVLQNMYTGWAYCSVEGRDVWLRNAIMNALVGTVQHCRDQERHTEHLCYVRSQGFHLEDAAAYAALIRNPRFRCDHCGRTAASRNNLCISVLL